MRLTILVALQLVGACHGAETSRLGNDGSGPVDASTADRVGRITISNETAAASSAGSAFASFGPANQHCTSLQTVGACTVSMYCGGSMDSFYSAGILDVSGSVPFSMSPGANGYYMPYQTSGEIYSPGSNVEIILHGDIVPSGQVAGGAPSQVTVTTDGTSFSDIDGSQDLSFAWSGSSAGSLQLLFHDDLGVDTVSSFDCRYPASSGAATIPAGVLQGFRGRTGAITISTVTENKTEIGTWSVTLRLGYNSVWSDAQSAQIHSQIR